jgi:hypothetical protein
LNSLILTIDDAVARTELLDRLYYLINYEGKSLGTDLFISLEDVKNEIYIDEVDYIIKQLAKTIWLDKLSSILFSNPRKAIGFEAWSNSLPRLDGNVFSLAGGAGGLNYHLDKDELAASQKGELHLPIFATALYIGPKEGINGGELMINTNGMDHFNSYDGGLIDMGERSGWFTVPFKYNRMVVFDSTFPHFVKPVVAFPENKPRTTIAINVWDRKLG